MTIIKIAPYNNGGHDNLTIDTVTPKTYSIPDGYAVIPESVGTPETLENYPFGEITVEDRGGVPTVTGWTPLPVPEPDPMPDPAPDTAARLAALEAETAAIAAAIERGMSL